MTLRCLLNPWRFTSEAEDKKLDASVFSRLWGYQNCLTATSSYKQFESWYGWVFRSYRELQIGQLENQSKPQDQSSLAYFAAAIEVVQRAINTLTSSLTGWHDLQYRASMGQQLVMEHPQHGYMPLAMLSDGLRNIVATVSDIAFRCIKLNPHLKDKAAQKTAGIVLIDEVDMFLHPAWQQQVLGALQEAFPLLQFIVTTHSPQVLTTVAKENIRQLGSDEHGAYARIPPFSPLAHENSDALAKVMETHSQPSLPLQETISEYELLVRSGEETSERATTLLAALEQAGYQFHESDLATWRFLAQRKLAAKGS
ncbi:AAA family ATPase [Enterobacter kobei]